MAPYLAKHDVSAIEFCARLGISPNVFQNADGWLPRAQCFHMANELAALLGDPFAGAHVGRLTELRDLGQWGQSVLAAENVADACVLAAANVSSIHHGSDVRFVVEGGTARIIFRFADRFEFDPRHFIFGSLAVLRKVPLLAGEPSAIKVRLTASRSRGSEALEECLGPNIEMGCDHDMIEIDRELLNLPLKIRRNRPSKVTEALASTVEAAKLLSERLSDGHALGLEVVARSIGMSARTLQRRLKFCGVDFEDLLDETRRGEAIRLICEGVHSMTDIAFRVGYSDSAHFTRAFKRWTGVAPSRFRTDAQRAP
ncbi:helix-turn-helix transcriptional regulator [Sinorhizobium terangae]|uniref:Helix-turn-helix domain-containing protein n=1 Tax=Sinorhizobium terangae TaxID=110322 RepID=A0A6N7LAG2_SINTE|nr:AraC family transcriptional regulator [Sinorhizobium terangae]MBB4184154.1 AraC-like DNA-binding protein [Sinorhizobium terangae]MQX14831.1 helix-turn-helix domain-containing protein [Sinorhizobium terangae]WFU48253.1 helix-turn-helix domain-containing protein [Sinorhizobium terangae]